MTLRLKPSRSAWVWWCALHALLLASTEIVAWPWPLSLAALGAILCHAVARRPRRAPGLILVSADAGCTVPDWEVDRLALGERTVVCSHWIRLDIGTGPRRRDLVLFADQLGRDEWTRLRALLERARCDGAHVPRRPREPI